MSIDCSHNKGDSISRRNTYRIINQLLDKQFSDTYSDYSSSSTQDYELTRKFADYFDYKIR